MRHRRGDTYIVTFPKTGTTLLSFVCHLLRSKGTTSAAWTSFEDIDQVVPHTSSAWFIDQDVNAEQAGFCRLFKSHRPLQQVCSWPCPPGVRYIASIREPTATLLSLHHHRAARGRFGDSVPSVLEYAQSSAWLHEHMAGCMPSMWDYYISFWKCRCVT